MRVLLGSDNPLAGFSRAPAGRSRPASFDVSSVCGLRLMLVTVSLALVRRDGVLQIETHRRFSRLDAKKVDRIGRRQQYGDSSIASSCCEASAVYRTAIWRIYLAPSSQLHPLNLLSRGRVCARRRPFFPHFESDSVASGGGNNVNIATSPRG
jgi:hypothetical protein